MYHFCTISSPDYLPFVETLHHSLRKYSGNIQLHVLVTGSSDYKGSSDLLVYGLEDLKHMEKVWGMVSKYEREPDNLRWALKQVLLSFLLQKHESVIYLDNDIYFFNSCQFLFEQLKDHSVLLSPHWCVFDPYGFEENFRMNFHLGLFNAGFIGVNQNAQSFLRWWADVCMYKMSKDTSDGFFVDQRYLDLALIVDSGIGIVRHLGCNVGSWNGHQNKRQLINGVVLINGIYPIVFIQFNGETIRHITNGNDVLLQKHYLEYEHTFSSTGIELEAFKETYIDKQDENYAIRLKRHLKLRTQLKKLV